MKWKKNRNLWIMDPVQVCQDSEVFFVNHFRSDLSSYSWFDEKTTTNICMTNKNNIYLLRKDLWSFDQSSFSFSIMQISKVFKFHSVNLHWNSFSKNCFKWNSWNLVKDARKVIFDLRFWCIFPSLNIGLL